MNSTNTRDAEILRHLARFGDRVRLAQFGDRDRAARLDQLERFDALGNVVLEHLEILDGEIGDRLAVGHHVGIDAHEVGARAEARFLLRRLLVLRLGRLGLLGRRCALLGGRDRQHQHQARREARGERTRAMETLPRSASFEWTHHAGTGLVNPRSLRKIHRSASTIVTSTAIVMANATSGYFSARTPSPTTKRSSKRLSAQLLKGSGLVLAATRVLALVR